MSSFASYLKSYPAKLALLVVLYILAGKAGLMLAIPPGYATMIWPPSGIALGMLIMHGRKLWPGILIGSFLLNAANGGAWSPADGIVMTKVMIAFAIAVGSTLQAVFGQVLVRRFIGLPLQLKHFRDLGRLFLVCGPVACLVAASVGVATLSIAGVLPADKIPGNWLAWWVGDLAGIVVFLPLMLVAPGSDERITWRGEVLGRLPAIAMLMVLLPLGLTFYAWKIASENAYEQSQAHFATMAVENEKALQQRLDSYSNALLGASAYWQGSQYVSHAEWHVYVDTLDLARNYPGISGIGWITPVTPANQAAVLKAVADDKVKDFTIHPDTGRPDKYVVDYLEPLVANRAALGLDIGFEPNRKAAAERARDSGLPAITHKVTLLQSTANTPGFLLMQPVYRNDVPHATLAERRAALRGWIYAPFVAQNFLAGLTASQGDTINLRIYDGDKDTPAARIYSSRADLTAPGKYSVRKTIVVGQNTWLIEWDSTPKFERAEQQSSPAFILVGGLLFTALFAVFVIVFSPRRSETLRLLAVEHRLILPSVIFIVLTAGSLVLYGALKDREHAWLHALIGRDATQIELLMNSQSNDRMAALERMSGRWDIAGGTPFNVWQFDAWKFTHQLAGLTAVQWVDATGHVRWIEPVSGNEQAVGADIVTDTATRDALALATRQTTPVFTAPRDEKPGYAVFTAYYPVTTGGRPDGFMAAVFSVDDFFRTATVRGNADAYQVVMHQGDRDYPLTTPTSALAANSWSVTHQISIGGQPWSFRVIPTRDFVASQLSPVPVIALVAGLIIAALTALALHALMLSRLRALELEGSHARLKASEASYRLLAENVPGMIGYWDKDLRCQFGNNAYFEWFGKDPDRLIGQSLREVIGDVLFEDNLPYVEGVLAGERQSFERRILKSNGESADTWAQYLPDYDASGAVIGFYVLVTDISALKQKEMALRESDALKEAVLSSTEYMVIATTVDGTVTVFNEAAERALGYKARDVIGRRVNPAWHVREEVIARTNQLNIDLADVLSTPLKPGFETFSIMATIEGKDSHEWTYIRKDGTSFTARVNITPLRDHDHRINGYLGVIDDVTERRAQELALKTSEETFRQAMENTSVGMTLTSPQGRWLRANSAMCDMLGYTEEEFLALDYRAVTHPDDVELSREYVANLLAGPVRSFQIEKRYLHKDGRVIWTLLTTSLICHTDGSPNYFVSHIHDITERREMERMKSEFISIVSHELRTPLTSIRGSLGLLAGTQADSLSEKANRLVQLAYKNSERLILLINDILDIDKIASGQMPFHLKAEPLADLVRQAVEANQPYAEKLSVVLDAGDVSGDLQVRVDAARFQQVMANLLSNAAKFSPSGSHVAIAVTTAGGQARITVTDRGPGIADEFKHRIFGRFSQADSSNTRDKAGTGLGLHISQQIVRHMDGQIGFDSVLGEGSSFWVAFPVTSAASALPAPAVDNGLPHILHIEDDLDLSQFLASALVDRARLTTATTLKEARRLIQAGGFDMYVLDINLPDGSGLQILDQLSAADVRTAPVVILSASEVPDDIRGRVSAAMVKSRDSEARMVNTLLGLLETPRPQEAA